MYVAKPRRKSKESIEAYNKRACKLYHDNGYLIKEIAPKLKLTEVEVYNYTCNNHITIEDERERMIKLKGQGLSIGAISKEVGRSKSCVRDRLSSPARVNCASNNILNDKQMKILDKMINDGYSIKYMANKLNISEGSLRYRIGNNIKQNTLPKPVNAKEIQRFIKLYKSGKSCSEIAKKCNRGETTVRKYLKQKEYIK